MKMENPVWLPLLVPSLAVSAASAISAYFVLGNLGAAALTAGACMICAIGNGLVIASNERRASAQLRRPELRGSRVGKTGVFSGLLTEAIELVESLERDNEAVTRCKAESEARTHVRKKKRRRIELALDCLDHPVLITDARDQVQFANMPCRRLFPQANDAPNNENIPPTLDVNQIPPLQALLEETRTRNAATEQRDAEFDWDNGTESIAYRATATNVYDDEGGLLGAVTILHDIRDEQEQNTRHAEFVSSVCHELKTPLASIKAFVELLMDGEVTDENEKLELYGFIDMQIDRLTRLVNNMLNLSRIESGVIKINREDCELNEVLHKALSVVKPTAEEKQIRVISELSDLYLPAHIDQDVFGQAVINLLSNAIKYTPQGGEVRLRSRMDEGQAIIEVRDNGMGIPAESLPHIFERFYRVPQNNKAAAGTGLGLALVHYIVTELHNGKISVDSTVDKGTCFTATIPLGHIDQSRKKQETALCPA